MIGMIILVAFIIGLLGVLPWWPHSRGWGYRPLGIGLIFFCHVCGFTFNWPHPHRVLGP